MHRPRTSGTNCFADAAGLQTQVSVATACCTGRGLLNVLIRATMDSVVNTSSRGCIGHTMAFSLIRLKGMVYGVYFVTGYAIRVYLMCPAPGFEFAGHEKHPPPPPPSGKYTKTFMERQRKRSRTFIFYSLTFFRACPFINCLICSYGCWHVVLKIVERVLTTRTPRSTYEQGKAG